MYLYLDERGAKNFKDWKSRIKNSGEDYFFIGGIFVKDRQIKNNIEEFVRKFKYYLHPDKKIEEWELKGSKDPFFKDKDFAKHKWLLWSNFLQKNRLDYKIYGNFVKLSYFFVKDKTLTEEDIVYLVLNNLILSFLLCECVEYKLNEISIPVEKNYKKSKIIFDNANDRYKDYIETIFIKINSHLKSEIKYDFVFISEKKFNNNDNLVIQFVDMQIFALTRFLFPINDNIFLNFESYPKKLLKYREVGSKEIFRLDRFEVQYYYDIAQIYYHIADKFQRCGWTEDNQQLTSLLLTTPEKIYKNFGLDTHILLKDFLNIFKIPSSEIYKVLNDKTYIKEILNDNKN